MDGSALVWRTAAAARAAAKAAAAAAQRTADAPAARVTCRNEKGYDNRACDMDDENLTTIPALRSDDKSDGSPMKNWKGGRMRTHVDQHADKFSVYSGHEKTNRLLCQQNDLAESPDSPERRRGSAAAETGSLHRDEEDTILQNNGTSAPSTVCSQVFDNQSFLEDDGVRHDWSKNHVVNGGVHPETRWSDERSTKVRHFSDSCNFINPSYCHLHGSHFEPNKVYPELVHRRASVPTSGAHHEYDKHTIHESFKNGFVKIDSYISEEGLAHHDFSEDGLAHHDIDAALEPLHIDSDKTRSSPTALSMNEPTPAVIDDTDESFLRILLETILPFTMAGFGCVFAGIVLDRVQHWEVFEEVSELMILVPALLGLKGNLEMTLASRLSTQANLGHMDTKREQIKMIGGNLALTQVQAVVVGFMASMVAILLGWVPVKKFDWYHGFLMCTSAVITASMASLLLGSMMVGVVLLSRKCRINPDNVATPFGGSLGDLTTISLLSSISMLLFIVLEHNHFWVLPTLLSVWLALTPLWWMLAHKQLYTRKVLHTGWVPVVCAMLISSFGGLILDLAVKQYQDIAVFQPVINGVGGNLVAVQASRLATALHRTTVPGNLPINAVHGCPNPLTTFFGKGSSAKTARVLLLMVIPGQLMFLFTIEFIKHGQSTITVAFVFSYLAAAIIQVGALLYIANWLVHLLWKWGHDPDNFSIPFLTAIGDLLGGALLATAFHLLHLGGDLSIVHG